MIANPRPRPSDGIRAPWQRNLWTIVVAELIVILGFQAGFILIPYYLQDMGIHDLRAVGAWTGAYQAVGSIGFAVSTPLWGVLGDRYGRKLMLMRAMVACVVILGLMGFVRTPMQLMALRVLQGFFTGTPSAASALVATSAPKERLAYALGLVQTAVFVGASLGPMAGGYIADAYGYPATFLASSAITVVPTLLVLFLVKEPAESAAAAVRARRENPFASFRSLLANRGLTTLIGLILMINLTTGLLGPVLPLFIQQLVADPDRLASTAGTISGVGAFSGAIAALVIGRLSDRIGHRRTLLGCAAGTGLLYIPQALARSATALGWLRGAQGFFQGGMSPSTSALVAGGAPKDKVGAALGLSTSAGSIGFALGPILGAGLLAATSARVTFLVAGGIYVLIVAAAAVAARANGSEKAPKGL